MENINEAVLKVLCDRLKYDEEEISKEDTLESLIGNEMYLLSHIILDIHERLNLKRYELKTNEEFNVFVTVSDLIKYFSEKV